MANKGDRFVAQSVIPNVPSMEVIYMFVQKGFAHIPDMPMYDLTVDIPGHPTGSTVSRSTLENSGFVLPNDAP